MTAQLSCIWVKSNESLQLHLLHITTHYFNVITIPITTRYNLLQITSLLCNAQNSLTLSLASSFHNWLISYQSEWFACACKQYFHGNTAVVMQRVIAAKFWLIIPISRTINPTILNAAKSLSSLLHFYSSKHRAYASF